MISAFHTRLKRFSATIRHSLPVFLNGADFFPLLLTATTDSAIFKLLILKEVVQACVKSGGHLVFVFKESLLDFH